MSEPDPRLLSQLLQGNPDMIDQLMQQRSRAMGAMDAMRGVPDPNQLVRMPQVGVPQGLDPRTMIDVGPQQGLPGGGSPQDVLQRLRGFQQ